MCIEALQNKNKSTDATTSLDLDHEYNINMIERKLRSFFTSSYMKTIHNGAIKIVRASIKLNY
jgi:hypothetical protein